MKKQDWDLYFITDPRIAQTTIEGQVRAAFAAGCKVMQYRDKDASTAKMVAVAAWIKKLLGKKALLLINDRVDVALAAKADGVHLGQDDMPIAVARKLLGKKKIIGVTVHSLGEAIAAQRAKVDYISVSPIFETKTKSDAGPACGPELISAIKLKVKLPVVAIGGINEANLKFVLDAGADSVAMISATVGQPDIKEAIGRIRKIILKAKK